MTKPYDIILWGATGYTGQLVADYLARCAPADLRWALAGRNQAKLESVRDSLTAVNPAAADLPIVLGDSLDAASMAKLAAQTRVVCTTVGPYADYGTPLVAACAAQGVDYCDITGEALWVRKNIASYHAQAGETGARIVHFCGVDSIPSDLGTLMVQEAALAQYGRACTEVKHLIVDFSGGFSGGTAASMLSMAEAGKDDPHFRRLLADPYSLVPERVHDWTETDLQQALYDADFGCWVGPFIMASINSRVVRRSHALHAWSQPGEFRYQEMMRYGKGVNGRLRAAIMGLGIQLLPAAAAVPPVQRLIEQMAPEPGTGPTAAERENGHFRTVLLGKIPDENGPGETLLKGVVAGNMDPGYGETSKMLAESALCLALDDLPRQGGILTPAAAMGMTLVARLRAAGMIFTVSPWTGV